MPTLELLNSEKIHYLQWNQQQQKTLLFIHGNFSSCIWWNDVIQQLNNKQKFHIIAIDQKGFGKSTYIHPGARFNDWALDVVDFCRLKNLKKVTLIGWSFGGAISMKTAQIAPDLVQNLILTASVSHKGLIMKDLNGNIANTSQQIQKLPHLQISINAYKNKDLQVMNNIFQIGLFQKMPNYPEQKKKQLINCSFQQVNYIDVLTALANSDINVDKIKVKSLMIHGKQDLVIKVDSIKQTGQILKGLQIWEQNGHMLPLENVERYVDSVIKFVLNQ